MTESTETLCCTGTCHGCAPCKEPSHHYIYYFGIELIMLSGTFLKVTLSNNFQII